MEDQIIDMGERAFIIINGPLVFLSLIANMFYACCLIFPSCNRQRLKQPSKTLLGVLVWYSIFYCLSLIVLYGLFKENSSFKMLMVSLITVLWYMHNSMTCSVWLVFYYYIQIVPTQRAFLIWVKRNIRSVIYTALLFDGVLFLFNGAVTIAVQTFTGFSSVNSTWTEPGIDELYFMSYACFLIMKTYIIICLCIMMVSSFSTVQYLHRHIRSVAQGGSCFSTSRIQSQLRVTITGISQGVLYFLFGTFYIFNSFTYIYSPHFYLSAWITFTATSLYVSGTTVNLGIGQATFRQRAADVWKKLKALFSVGMVTNDVKVHSSQLTSGEIAVVIQM